MLTPRVLLRSSSHWLALALVASCTFACDGGGAFKQAVSTWTAGEGYKGAVARVRDDQELDDTSRRLELMNLSGLACTLDEDRGASTEQNATPACKCAKPGTGADQQLIDCKTWASAP